MFRYKSIIIDCLLRGGGVSNKHCLFRKPAFCIYENKGADQLYSNRNQRLYFCYIESTILLLSEFKISSLGYIAWFISDLFGNPLDMSSHVAAHDSTDPEDH